MGVPAFFRWLTKKYPLVVTECERFNEESPKSIKFDNLYIDMNGIIHPCTHPEDESAPENEDDMILSIFQSIDRIFNIVKPRKLLYLAVDGVAPRAKINQQRSRRFRSAQETQQKNEKILEVQKKLNCVIPLQATTSVFDSNCITPGTKFMARLTICLNYYIYDRMTNDPNWKEIKVILSDSSVPGEGEHKVMNFIRRQRANKNHDPNTHHCICGADADLIMLGLATHEPNFTIIREEFIPNTKVCCVCGDTGHEFADCSGAPKKTNSMVGNNKLLKKKFIYIRLSVLREYLERELKGCYSFDFELERAIDDWLFMCFFVGNDFLPHLPSLAIHEGAIDNLVIIYKKTFHQMKGYITDNGDVNLEKLQIIIKKLGEMEDSIFKKRRDKGDRFRSRRIYDKNSRGKARNQFILETEDVSDPVDEVKLWENGYKERYYELKLNVKDPQDISKIALEYVRGLCWVLKYYFQDCVSWNWYYPYYYAPFASDFVDIFRTNRYFDKGAPFKPLEQLMGVLPPASSSLVPKGWEYLMKDPFSPILDFYPRDFLVDLNGKRFSWQGVVLLPFVDENRLKKSLPQEYLTQEERNRNKFSHDRLYAGIDANCFKNICNTYKCKKHIMLDGINGFYHVAADEFYIGKTIPAPIKCFNGIKNNSIVSVTFSNPQYPDDYVFKSSRLEGAIEPPRVLQPENNIHRAVFPEFNMSLGRKDNLTFNYQPRISTNNNLQMFHGSFNHWQNIRKRRNENRYKMQTQNVFKASRLERANEPLQPENDNIHRAVFPEFNMSLDRKENRTLNYQPRVGTYNHMQTFHSSFNHWQNNKKRPKENRYIHRTQKPWFCFPIRFHPYQ